MALTRWKDKPELTTLVGTEKLPITDDAGVDKYVTPDTIASLNDAAIASVALTANQKLGLDNSLYAIDTDNTVVSQTELAVAISNVQVSSSGQDNYIQNYEVDNYISGTGVLRTLAGLGYSTAQIRAKFPRMYYVYGDVSTSLSYDTAVIREAILSLGYGNQTYVTTLTNRLYLLNEQVIIPSIKLDVVPSNREHSQQRIIDFKGCRINDIRTGTSSTPLFIKEPENETSAGNNDLELSLRFANADIYGEDVASVPYANSVCMKIGAAKRFELDNVVIHNYDVGFHGSLLLNSFITKSEFLNCITSGVKTSTGWWSGALASRSPSQLTFINTRFKDAGLKYCDLTNCDTSSFYGNNQFEGNGGNYAIYWDNQNGSVIKNLTVTNLRVEQESKFARAILGIKSGDGFSVSLDKVFHQAVTSGTVLVEAEATGGGDTRIDISRCYNSGGATSFKLRNIGSNCWDIKQTILQGQPANETQLLSSIAPYDNIWDLTNGGSIPSPNRVQFQQRLPKL